jgi:hypothetical protein
MDVLAQNRRGDACLSIFLEYILALQLIPSGCQHRERYTPSLTYRLRSGALKEPVKSRPYSTPLKLAVHCVAAALSDGKEEKKIEKKVREKRKKEEGKKIEKNKRMNYLFFEIRIHNLY